MSRVTKSISASWNEWVVYHHLDPIVRLTGVNQTRDPQQVKAAFETLSGLQVLGDVADLRDLEYDLLKPFARIRGHSEVYDYGSMSPQQHDRWLQLCHGIDLIHDRQIYLRSAESRQDIANYEIERIRRLGPRPR